MIRCRTGISGERPQFLDRAEADAVRLSQGAVDRSRLGDAHLSPMDKGGDIGRIGVPVANEASRSRTLVDRSFKDPTAGGLITRLQDVLNLDADTTLPRGQTHQTGMGHIPPSTQVSQIPQRQREAEFES